MKSKRLSAREWGERIILYLLFTTLGSLIMIVFSPWRPLLGSVNDYLGRIGLIVLLLIAVLVVRKSKRLEKYWQVLLGLLIMAVAVSLDWVFGNYMINHLSVNGETPVGFALMKLNECAVIVGVIITFTMASGGSLGSIYIQKGNLKLGLIIGLIAFFIAVAGSIPMANLFNAKDLSLARMIPWIPWVLIFVLTNAALEAVSYTHLTLPTTPYV